MEYSKHKAFTNTSDTDSTDSYAVVSETLTTSDDEDDFDKSKTKTHFSRSRSVPYLRNNSSSNLRHASSALNNLTLNSAQNERMKSKNKTRPNSSQRQTSCISERLPERFQEGFNKNDLIVSSLKSTFADVLVPFSGPDDHLVSKIQGLFDTEEDRIDFLEQKLQEKKNYLKKLRTHRVQHEDKEDTLPLLLDKYPVAMNRCRKKIEEEEYRKEHDRCALEFEQQKQEIISKHKHNYKVLKDKYEKEFKKELRRIEIINVEMERDIEASFS